MALFLLHIYLITFYIRPQDWVPFFMGWPVDYIIIIPTILAGLFNRMTQRDIEKKFIFTPVHLCVAIYLLIIPMSNIVNGNSHLVMDSFIMFFKKITVFIMFVLILDNETKLRKIVRFIVFLTIIMAIQGVSQSITGLGWANQELYKFGTQGMRVKWIGYWDGANIMAVGLILGFPFLAAFFAETKKAFLKIMYFLGLSIVAYGVYLTNSRGGFVAFASLPLAFIGVKFKGWKRVILLVFICLLVPLLMKFGPSRVSQLDTKESSYHQRTWLWEQGINMLQASPLLGVGKRRFIEISSRNQPAHSNFIQNFAEVGIIGFFFWFGSMYFCFKWLFRISEQDFLKDKSYFLHILSKAMLVSFFSFNVGALFITVEEEPLYMMLGLAVSIVALAKHYDKEDVLNLKFKMTDFVAINFGSAIILGLYYLLAYKELL